MAMGGTVRGLHRATLISSGTSPTSSIPDLLRRVAAFSVESIAGIFVEDRALLRAAALPAIREIGRVSGMLQSLDRSAIETTLRREAERLRVELATIAAELQWPWSFDVTQGDLVAETFGHAAGAQLAVLQRSGRPCRDARVVDRSDGRAGIVVLTDTASGGQLFDVAVALANAEQRRLTVYLPAATLPADTLRRRLTDRLRTPLGIETYADTRMLVRSLLRRSEHALLLPTSIMTSMDGAFEPLLRQVGTSVLLLD